MTEHTATSRDGGAPAPDIAAVDALLDRAMRLLDDLDGASRGLGEGDAEEAGEAAALAVESRQPIVDELALLGARLAPALGRLSGGAHPEQKASIDRRAREFRARIAARSAADGALLDALRSNADAMARSMADLRAGQRAAGVYGREAMDAPAARFQDRSA